MSRDLTNVIGYIYKITSPNNKIYIGQTINKKQRKYHYKKTDFKQQTKLWHNVQKYKWNPADTFEVIETLLCGSNKVYLNEREKYWIKFYDSFVNGLNCNDGGEGNCGHKFTEETLQKMRNSKLGIKHPEWRNKQKSIYTKGRKHSEDTKKKISIQKKKNMTDDIKMRISNGLQGNKNGLGNKGGSRKILCINNGKIYDSILKAANELNLHSTGIIQVCKSVYNQTKGYKFKYMD